MCVCGLCRCKFAISERKSEMCVCVCVLNVACWVAERDFSIKKKHCKIISIVQFVGVVLAVVRYFVLISAPSFLVCVLIAPVYIIRMSYNGFCIVLLVFLHMLAWNRLNWITSHCFQLHWFSFNRSCHTLSRSVVLWFISATRQIKLNGSILFMCNFSNSPLHAYFNSVDLFRLRSDT